MLVAPSNAATQISPRARRGFDVTATLLALLRHKSRRRRAPRPAAGSPTHAIAGTRARAVTMATDRPPSLLNHSRRLALKLPCATTLSSLDAAVVTRRRRRVTSFAFPSGGAPTGASLHLDRLPGSNDGGPAPSMPMRTAPTAARASRLFAHVRRDVQACNCQLGIRRQSCPLPVRRTAFVKKNCKNPLVP